MSVFIPGFTVNGGHSPSRPILELRDTAMGFRCLVHRALFLAWCKAKRPVVAAVDFTYERKNHQTDQTIRPESQRHWTPITVQDMERLLAHAESGDAPKHEGSPGRRAGR